jgi:uncharacterized membrane protein (DUF485 family)
LFKKGLRCLLRVNCEHYLTHTTFTLTLFIVSIYVAYILIDAFNRELLARKISGGITLGIYIGIGIIIIGWITTGIYVWWANNKYDSLLDRIKRTTGGHS